MKITTQYCDYPCETAYIVNVRWPNGNIEIYRFWLQTPYEWRCIKRVIIEPEIVFNVNHTKVS
jgi:hypothetical protein